MAKSISIKVGHNYKNMIEELRAVAEFDRSELLDFIGREAIDNDIKTSFKEERDAETEEKWVKSKRAEENDDKTLVDSTNLKSSINYRHNNIGNVEVGTAVIYASKHQDGKGVMKRRFLGVRRDFQDRVFQDSGIKRMLRL